MPRSNFNQSWAEDPAQFEDPRLTEPDLLVTGWQGGISAEAPKAKYQNYWQNRADSALQEIEQNGALSYLNDAQYRTGAHCIASNGERYRSVSSPNVGNDPVSDDGSNWVLAPYLKKFDYLHEKNGFDYLTSGLKIQWFFIVVDGPAATTSGVYNTYQVQFPEPFQQSCLSVIASFNNLEFSPLATVQLCAENEDAEGVQVAIGSSNSYSQQRVKIMAIGI